MRIVMARINHETNTFSPLSTPLSAFTPLWGEAAAEAACTSNTAIGAFHAYARERGADIAVPVFAMANPSGPVADDAFEALAGAVLKEVAVGCDIILLDLHGAMVTQSLDDGEGELLERVRSLAPDVPLGLALDLHANLTNRILDNCDCVVGFKTYPHIDMYETGEHVTRIIDAVVRDGLRPVNAWRHPPLLAHTLSMNTTQDNAMAALIARAREAETGEGVLAASIFGGFSLADIETAGVSIAVTATSADLAGRVAREIADEAWERREEFLFHEEPLATSIARARQLAQQADEAVSGPVLLLDHGDNCMSGGTCDVMDVLEAALDAGLEDIVCGPISDAVAVDACWTAGEGAGVALQLGNKVRTQGFGALRPLAVSGIVEAVGEGRYTVSGPIYTGQTFDMGRAAVLRTPTARILITEQPHEPWDAGVFECLGTDPFAARFLILKSRMYCRPVFEPRARAVVACASRGVTSSNYGLFAFRKLARPVFPLDRNAVWKSRG